MKKKILISLIITILGLVLTFVVHELSHCFVLELMGGTTESISIGIKNYVVGYIPPGKISVVALSSIFIPLTISCVLVFIKQLYVQIFCGVFTVSPLIHCLFGIIINIVEKDIAKRATYDVVLAIDNAIHPMGIWVFVLFCLILAIAIILYNGKYIIDNF